MTTALKNINDLLDELGEDIKKMIETRLSKVGQISLGVDVAKFNGRCAAMRINLSLANRLLSLYCQFLNGKTLSIQSFNEISALSKLTPEAIDTRLRIAYLEHNKIPLPKFRIDVLANGYDFEEKELTLIEEIKKIAEEYSRTRSAIRDHEQYFNTKNFKFEFTNSDEEKLRDQFTKKASEKDILPIIARYLLAFGLNNLQGSIPGGSLRFSNDTELKGVVYNMGEDSYSLDWAYLVGPLYEQDDQQFDIKIIPVGGSELPKIAVNGRVYQFRSPSTSSFLNGAVPGETVSKIIFKEALNSNPELFFRVTTHLLKKGSGILVDIGPDISENEETLQTEEA